jgi:hypothetical protein
LVGSGHIASLAHLPLDRANPLGGAPPAPDPQLRTQPLGGLIAAD